MMGGPRKNTELVKFSQHVLLLFYGLAFLRIIVCCEILYGIPGNVDQLHVERENFSEISIVSY